MPMTLIGSQVVVEKISKQHLSSWAQRRISMDHYELVQRDPSLRYASFRMTPHLFYGPKDLFYF
jgi:hypothetical protein